jgi:hypothetical protein
MRRHQNESRGLRRARARHLGRKALDRLQRLYARQFQREFMDQCRLLERFQPASTQPRSCGVVSLGGHLVALVD